MSPMTTHEDGSDPFRHLPRERSFVGGPAGMPSPRDSENGYGVPPHAIPVTQDVEPSDLRQARPSRERRHLPRAAAWIGLLVLAAGAVQLLLVATDLVQLGTPSEPRVLLRLNTQLNQGALTSFAGAVLAAGGFYLHRGQQRPPTMAASSAVSETRLHRNLLALSVLVTLAVVVLSVLPTPSRNVAYNPGDFRPLAQPTNVTSYGAYRVSRNFWADRGSVFDANVQITWNDNRTGAALFGGQPGTFEVYAASASSPRESPKIADSFVVPTDGFYVLVVWLGRCPTLTKGECANTTPYVQAQLRAFVPTTYLPAQLGGGIAGPGLVILSAAGLRSKNRFAPP